MIKARLKYIVKSQKGKVPKVFTDVASLLPYLSMEYLRDKNEIINYVIDDGNCFLVNENESLILWDGANAGEIMLSKKGFLSSTMAVLTPDENYFQKRFFYYFLKSKEREFKKAANGTTIPHLDQEIVFKTKYSIAPLSEQKKIADYLDTQSEKINHFIKKKQRFIELLKEQRKSIINQAVTKGINPNVKMKSSGIEWLGDVPEHWEVRRLKNVCKIINGATPSSEIKEYWDGNINWVTPAEFGDEIYINDSMRKITEKGMKSCATTIVPKGSIIISTRAPIGSVAIASIPLCTNQGCRSIIAENIYNYFVYYFFKTQTTTLNILGNGTTFKELSGNNLKDFKIPVPQIEEQKEIVDYIKTETQTIDTAITKAEKEIELIKEYKEAMISEAVMGKREEEIGLRNEIII